MSAKMRTPGLLKITVFWNKDYEVINFADGVTSKILSRDSNHIVDVLMWPKFANCSISLREVITSSTLEGFDQKNRFFGGSWFNLNNLGLALGTNLKFYNSVEKGLKLIVRKFGVLILTFVEVTGEKLVGLFAPLLHHHPEQG